MKLIFETINKSEAEEIKSLLEDNGIPATMSNEYMHDIRRYGANSLGVWIYINTQEDDALKLIENPDYKVTSPVSIGEFYSHVNSSVAKEKTYQLIFKASAYSLVILCLLIMVVYVINKTQT